MKLVPLIPLLALNAVASEVRLAWDASPSPGITNYVLYASGTNSLSLSSYTQRLNVGTNLTATIQDLVPGQWLFGVTAMKDGMQSDFSNHLSRNNKKKMNYYDLCKSTYR